MTISQGLEELPSRAALLNAPNVPDQWLAARGLSKPLGPIASPLHRVVRCNSERLILGCGLLGSHILNVVDSTLFQPTGNRFAVLLWQIICGLDLRNVFASRKVVRDYGVFYLVFRLPPSQHNSVYADIPQRIDSRLNVSKVCVRLCAHNSVVVKHLNAPPPSFGSRSGAKSEAQCIRQDKQMQIPTGHVLPTVDMTMNSASERGRSAARGQKMRHRLGCCPRVHCIAWFCFLLGVVIDGMVFRAFR
jgi:hypothetical protein